MKQDLKEITSNTFQHYLKKISFYPVLSSEEEQQLAIQIQNGSLTAKKELVEKNLRLVICVIKKYRRYYGDDFLDLIEEGNIGLIKAAEKFDPTLGFRFSTYAIWWIKQAVETTIRNKELIKIPDNLRAELKNYSKQISDFKSRTGRSPLVSEMMKITSKSREKIIELNNYLKIETLSLDVEIESGNKEHFIDNLIDNNHKEPTEEIHLDYLIMIIDQWLDTLQPEQSEVIARHFGLKNYPKSNLGEISKIMNLPVTKVKKLQEAGLKKLRKLALDNDMIDVFE